VVSVGDGGARHEPRPASAMWPLDSLRFTSLACQCNLGQRSNGTLIQAAAERLSCTQLEFRVCIIAREARQLSNQE
jgi:hypothetical protein